MEPSKASGAVSETCCIHGPPALALARNTPRPGKEHLLHTANTPAVEAVLLGRQKLLEAGEALGLGLFRDLIRHGGGGGCRGAGLYLKL